MASRVLLFGCGPYDPGRLSFLDRTVWPLARTVLAPSKVPLALAVHLGDVFEHEFDGLQKVYPKAPGTTSGEGREQRRCREYFRQALAPVSTLFTPGDKGWLDFMGISPSLADDIEKAHYAWRQWDAVLGAHTAQARLPAGARWLTGLPTLDEDEDPLGFSAGNRALVLEDGTLLVLLHRSAFRGFQNGRYLRYRANADRLQRLLEFHLEFLDAAVASAREGHLASVVVCGHAKPYHEPNTKQLRRFVRRTFRPGFDALVKGLGVPCLYVHADSHQPKIKVVHEGRKAQYGRVCVGALARGPKATESPTPVVVARPGRAHLFPALLEIDNTKKNPFRVHFDWGTSLAEGWVRVKPGMESRHGFHPV